MFHELRMWFIFFIMTQNQRWNKNNKEAQFIVRKLIEGSVNIQEPKYKKFLDDFPNFGEYNKRSFQRNFKNTVQRWKSFVDFGQGKFYNSFYFIIV